MSYQTARWQSLGENSKTGVFSEGYVDNTPNLYLPDGASPYLRNARLDGNTVHIRKGHRLFETLSSVGKGLGTYLRSDEFYDRLVVRENIDTNKKIWVYDLEGNKTEINTSTNITSDVFCQCSRYVILYEWCR